MYKLNLDFLTKPSIEEILTKIESIFHNLLQEIKNYTTLETIYSKVKFEFIDNQRNLDFINFCTTRKIHNDELIISIYIQYREFIKIILLREAYKCFIPNELQDNIIVNIFINQKVDIDLQNSDLIEDWRFFLRNSIISYDFMEKEFDRLGKFLSQESTENRPSPFQYFLLYLRKNFDVITNITENVDGNESFYNKIFKEYIRKYTDYSNEILETIRIIITIFYNVKSYRSLLDYQNLFQKFKKTRIIDTQLSLRKFMENMQWIKEFSTISPSYQINWPILNIASSFCIIKFHPLIENSKIYKIIDQIPFLFSPRYSKTNFGLIIFCLFFIPKIYLNDLISFLEKLEEEGYIINKKIFIINRPGYTANLNCFNSRAFIIDPDKQNYKKDYEIYFEFDYGKGKFESKLQLLDWLIIDRIRYYSITGLGFERKSETLSRLKSDLINEITSQRKLINEIKKDLDDVNSSANLREYIISLIQNNKKFGFFSIKQTLYDYITILDKVKDILIKNPSIRNFNQFIEYIKKFEFSKVIEENLKFGYYNPKILREVITSFFKSKEEFNKKLDLYQKSYKLFKSLYVLKLFNLQSIQNIIKDKSLIQKIYQSKEKKLRTSYQQVKLYKITFKYIEKKLEDFLQQRPPIIKPVLINTLGMAPFTKFFLNLILKNTSKSREAIEKIKWHFPRVIIGKMSEYKTQDQYIYFQLQLSNLKVKEKQLLFSVLQGLFKDQIIIGKPNLSSGFREAYSRKDFYDLEKEDFYYTSDLFEQFYRYSINLFGITPTPFSEITNEEVDNFWMKKKNMKDLIQLVKTRISKEHIDLSFNNLSKLEYYNKNLQENLLNIENFKYSKKDFFFKNCINFIKFIPAFHYFGFSQYYLYFYPINLNEIDFKHLLHNSFQKLKFPASIDNSNSFMIQYIWPFRNPNISLLNWLTKSKKAIREYCLYFIKKVYQIFHFNRNLGINEWDLDPNRFKAHIRNILFSQDSKSLPLNLQEFNTGNLKISDYLPPESPEYEALTQIYDWKCIDIKSYLGSRNFTLVNNIIDLIEKNLIFPYVSIKNLGLIDKLYIVLPNIKKEYFEKLLKIFNFFNIGFIFEIEGEYYIYGMPEEVKFENGLMIKLYLPECQLDEFERLYDQLFEYLGIKHYVILNDLIDGKDFLKSIYGNLDFLNEYNPLKNLIWNEKDKIWMNHKLFNEKFEKIYPALNPNKKS